jgi:methyl-accepting chemotaxis protein
LSCGSAKVVRYRGRESERKVAVVTWLKNLKVGARLIFSFFVMMLLMALVGFVGYLSINDIHRHLQSIFAVNLAGIDYLIETDRDLQQLLVAERSMIFANAQSEEFKGFVAEYEENLRQAGELWGKYKAIASTPAEREVMARFEKARQEWQVVSRRIVDGRIADTREGRREALDLSLGEARKKFEEMRNCLNELTGINLQMAEAAHQDSGRTYRSTLIFLMSATGVGLMAAIFLVLGLGRGVTRPLKGMIDDLSAAANQLQAGSAQLAAGSQTLAAGASRQTAAIEETSSSIDKLSSMIRANADNAGEARGMMATAAQIVEKVNRHMIDMAAAIDEINKSSEETGKIIKTIDEIAFQTNLLALNAAVEAARAGEAGAGFAVVAGEVRNLAMRAAEAAKNTALLIDETSRAVQHGNALTASTREAFAENIDISRKVSGLVREIAGASAEQAQDIELLSKAIADMDSVVQSVAANAQETAATAAEMNGQAGRLQDMVDGLTALVGRRQAQKSAAAGSGAKSRERAVEQPAGREQRPAALAAPAGGREKKRESGTAPARERKPEQLIPLDEEEFADF